MFTYINENFLHAPSTDLSRDTVKSLINITLAQSQEVFLEKQITDGKKPGFLAKLASQAAYLYSQATDTVQENVTKGIFEKVWSIVVQAKASHLSSVASYYQALADAESGSHGVAIARLQLSEKLSTAALTWAKSFPSSVPASSNLLPEAGASLMEMITRQQTMAHEKLTSLIKDNDFIYHQPVPNEAGLSAVSKLPAAKAIPVSELYQGQDIQRVIGPDIFSKLVPIAVTESASLYDEEKAKLIRAETEKVETANGEMAASLDYLKLPGSLGILKGGIDEEITVDEEFRRWCDDMAGHDGFHKKLDQLQENKAIVVDLLSQCSRQLDMEESVCEKMRSKYGADWTQQPSSRLTSSLRSDVWSLRHTINEASASDTQLNATLKQYEADFDEMRSAGETDEADVLFQRAMIKAGPKQKQGRNGPASPYEVEGSLLDDVEDESSVSVVEQIAKVEELLKKLNLVKRERVQVLKDLKEKVHEDDISNVLILNKKTLGSGQENQLFQAELEKFRPYQNRIIKSNHTQAALMKELTKVYGDLLQDKRVRSEQTKYESITRQRNTVMGRYKKVYNAFQDLISGLSQAQKFYDEMRETVDSLRKNVDTFVSNRRSEGAQLLNQIERDKAGGASGQEDREREKLRQLMERLSTEPTPSSSSPSKQRPAPPLKGTSYSSGTRSPPVPSPHYPQPVSVGPPPSQPPAPYGQYLPPAGAPVTGYYGGQSPFQQGAAAPLSEGYNPMAYPYQTPVSPPPNQQYFVTSTTPTPYSGYPVSANAPPAPSHPPQFIPQGYIPPPPPPLPTQPNYPPTSGPYPSGPGGYAKARPHGTSQQHHKASQQQPQPSPNDPWAGLNAWK
jgi:hypothetical protein